MKKNGLFKILLILLIAVSILTWFIPASYYDGTGMVDLGMFRIGFFDFFQFINLTFDFSNFFVVILFLLAIGALYGVLSKTGAYRNILEKIAKSLKGKEKIFLIVVTFVFAALSSVFGFELLVIIFIPAIISLILMLGFDKVTAFMATFMANLIGVIGATLSYATVGYINEQIGTTFGTQIFAKIALFVISYLIYTMFLLGHADKIKKSKNKEAAEEEMFVSEKKTTKVSKWPVYALFGVLFVILVLACTKWNEVFGIEVFQNVHKAVTEFTIKDNAVFSYILGDISEFGAWSYSQITVVILVLTLIVGKIYKFKGSEIIDYMVDGAKKMMKPALLAIFAYAIVYIVGNTVFFNTITSWVVGLTKHLSVGLSSIILLVGSVLHIDMVYLSSYILPIIAGSFTNTAEITTLAIMSQSLYGVTMFVAPTSIMLVIGLTYLNIPYKEWLKTSWKFVLQLLAIIIVISLIIRYL